MRRMATGFVTLALVGLCVGTALAQNASGPSDDRQLLGVWDLVSIEDRDPKNEVSLWLGQHPTGTITYSPGGRMAVQFMGDPPPAITAQNAWQGREINPAVSISELRDALGGYYAYFGTYKVDPVRHVVTHHIRASLRPSEVGIDYERPYRFDGDRLILRYPNTGGRTRTITFRKAEQF